jgi:hypothetical protein
MSIFTRARLPLGPLLHAYCSTGAPALAQLSRGADLGSRCDAITGATTRFLHADYLDAAPETELSEALVQF